VLKIYDACNRASAIRFVDEVIRRLPFRLQVIQTNNGAEFHSRFHWHLEAQDIRHVYIRPRTPHLNGKVERLHRVESAPNPFSAKVSYLTGIDQGHVVGVTGFEPATPTSRT
jgi:transposase InsO family protein